MTPPEEKKPEEAQDTAAAAASAEDAPDASPSDAEPVAAAATDDSSSEPAEKPKRRRSRKPAEPKTEAETPVAEAETPVAEAETPVAEAETPVAEVEKPARNRGAQPAPTRRRSRRAEGEPAAVVRAQAKYVRSSARKARLVCDHIRGKSVEEARAILALTPRAIARDWSKLLESAVANAEHNHELVGEDLYVKAVHADEGPTIKRFRPRAMGRATQIRKRTSHLTILLTQKD